jgi:DNA-3-methyladenine glycosylase II
MSGPAVSTRPARSYKQAADILSERDPVLRRLVAQAGPVRVNPPTETHFAALVRAILYQQLAGAAARAIHGRLVAALGGEVTPERFLSLSSQTLRAVGLSANKAASMRDLATKVLDGSVVLDPAGLRGQGDDEVVAMLAGVRGIGTWTAQMFLMFQLRRLDVWPAAISGCGKGSGWRGGCRRRLRNNSRRSATRTGPTVRSWRGTAGAPPSSTAVPRKARSPASWSLARPPGHAAASRPTDCAS